MKYPNDTHVSEHLAWAELACKDGTSYPLVTWRERAVVLAAEFEAVRALAGHRPITVTSAYRPDAYNRSIGGAEDSQHIYGRAVDVVGESSDHHKILGAAIEIRSGLPESMIRGVGVYADGGLHFDTRPGDRIARWDSFTPAEAVA